MVGWVKVRHEDGYLLVGVCFAAFHGVSRIFLGEGVNLYSWTVANLSLNLAFKSPEEKNLHTEDMSLWTKHHSYTDAPTQSYLFVTRLWLGMRDKNECDHFLSGQPFMGTFFPCRRKNWKKAPNRNQERIQPKNVFSQSSKSLCRIQRDQPGI